MSKEEWRAPLRGNASYMVEGDSLTASPSKRNFRHQPVQARHKS
jgi:hypothetical protein